MTPILTLGHRRFYVVRHGAPTGALIDAEHARGRRVHMRYMFGPWCLATTTPRRALTATSAGDTEPSMAVFQLPPIAPRRAVR